jgi:hypothetical protein
MTEVLSVFTSGIGALCFVVFVEVECYQRDPWARVSPSIATRKDSPTQACRFNSSAASSWADLGCRAGLAPVVCLTESRRLERINSLW